MRINSLLIQGSGTVLASKLSSYLGQQATATTTTAKSSLDALVLLSLGVDHSIIIDAVQKTSELFLDECPDDNQKQLCCPTYLAETYGIIGYDDEKQCNVELMEKGRGSEYGYVGGSGGQGCLAITYSNGAIGCHSSLLIDEEHNDDNLLSSLSSMMVIADSSGEFLNHVAQTRTTTAGSSSSSSRRHSIPIYYGGVAKETHVLMQNKDDGNDNNGLRLKKVPYFYIGSKEKNTDSSSTFSPPIGISAFTGNAKDATNELLSKLSHFDNRDDDNNDKEEEQKETSLIPSGDIGLFPCYTRGINHYDKENVEVNAITDAFFKNNKSSPNQPTQPRIYGMFAHGELGPLSTYKGFISNNKMSSTIPCEKHSMTSILSIHTTTTTKEEGGGEAR